MVVALGVNKSMIENFANTLNCTHMEISFKYLGLMVGGNPRRKQFWSPLVEKIRSKLNAWKGRYLTVPGRIYLIKFVFTSLPLFYLSFFKAPVFVYKTITNIQKKNSMVLGEGKQNYILG